MALGTVVRVRILLVAMTAVLLLLVGSPVVAATASAQPADPLPSSTDVDYQLGGVRTVPDSVGIVVRDRKAKPLPGRYNVCYVNAFQTQPEDRGWWRRHHPNLILKKNGRPVSDTVWHEWLFDVRTEKKRTRLARVVGQWIGGCADDGFDAVEFDNLDSFTRSRSMIERRGTLAFAERLNEVAESHGLPSAQKNLAQYDGTRIGFDFAIAEECGAYEECVDYERSYGDQVIAVEYRNADFRFTCRQFGDQWPVVRRDRALKKDGVRRFC